MLNEAIAAFDAEQVMTALHAEALRAFLSSIERSEALAEDSEYEEFAEVNHERHA